MKTNIGLGVIFNEEFNDEEQEEGSDEKKINENGHASAQVDRASEHEGSDHESDEEKESSGGRSIHSGAESDARESDEEMPRKKRKILSDADSEDESAEQNQRKSNSGNEDASGNESDGKLKRKRQLSSDEEQNESGQESDYEVKRKKPRKILDDDSEQGSDAERNDQKDSLDELDEMENNAEKNEDDDDGSPKATAEDLFGEDVDISSDEEGKKEASAEREIQREEMDEMEMSPKDTQEEVDEPPPETRIELEIPRICTNLGREVNFVKLPNFLSVDTRPYDPQWFEDEIDEDEVLDEEGRARLKLKGPEGCAKAHSHEFQPLLPTVSTKEGHPLACLTGDHKRVLIACVYPDVDGLNLLRWHLVVVGKLCPLRGQSWTIWAPLSLRQWFSSDDYLRLE